MPASSQPARTGLLLVNLGTPASPSTRDVRRYLREFLMDPRVLEMPTPLRWLLVHGAILPFRPKDSARMYQSVWLEEGSPLLVHSRAQAEGVATELGDTFEVVLAMRYGEPSIERGLNALRDAGCRDLVLMPLYPQSAQASTGTTIAKVEELLPKLWPDAAMRVVPPFHGHPAHVAAVAETARPHLEGFGADHVLFSYHGLPESTLRTGSGAPGCLESEDCCAVFSARNAGCYRAQCFQTTRDLSRSLGLEPEQCSTAFQSRLGRAAWIHPYTDEWVVALREQGVKRLAVLTPAFVADCLETVEEVGIRLAEQWKELGGEALCAVPCPNAAPAFVSALAGIAREASREVPANAV